MKSLKFVHLITLLLTLAFLAGCDDDNNDDAVAGGIYGLVADENTSEPIRGATVKLFGPNDETILHSSTVTYSDGHFEFDNLPAGNYFIAISYGNYAPLDHRITVKSNTISRAVDLAMVPGLTVTTNSPSNSYLHGSYENHSTIKVTECGFFVSNVDNPVQTGRKYPVLTFDSERKTFEYYLKLTSGTWHIVAYCATHSGEVYGDEVVIEVKPKVGSVEMDGVDDITATSAMLNAYIPFEGDPAFIKRGFVISASSTYPSIDDPSSISKIYYVPGRDSDFSCQVFGLTPDKVYYIRAFLQYTNDVIYSYGESFRTRSK